MANRYWVLNSGTDAWDASATANWSATSGGSGGASAPTSADAVFFNNLSGTGTCFINPGAVCASLTIASNLSLTEIGGNALAVHGNVSLASSKDFSGLVLSFEASGSLTSNSKSISHVTAKAGATLTVSDAMNCETLTVENTGAIVLPSGATSVCTSFVTPGSGSSSLTSSSAGSQAALSDSSGTNDLTYITVQDIEFTGGATWTQGTGFTDGGNNSFPNTATVPVLFAQSLA